MRYKPGKTEKNDQASPISGLLYASLLFNALLVCLLLWQPGHQGPRPGLLPAAPTEAELQAQAEVHHLYGEFQNINAALEDALASLQAQKQLESEEPQLDLQELVRENAALQGALADLKQRLEDQAREVVLKKDSALHASGDLLAKSLERQSALQMDMAALKQQVAGAGLVSANVTQLAVSSADAKQAASPFWLTIGIPTVPRKSGVQYLRRVLESLLEELPVVPGDLLYGRLRVIVMNNRPGNHTAFDEVRDEIAGGAETDFVKKGQLYVQFLDNPGTVQDPKPNAKEPDDNNNPHNVPGREVRRQTCDLISLMEAGTPNSEHYMFMEDDFRACPGMMRILEYCVQKLNAVPKLRKWVALRFSYGMNGILVPTSLMPSLIQYTRKHTHRLPADLIWLEWFKGKRPELFATVRGRHLAVYRYNLLDHIGAYSSFSSRVARPDWPKCFAPMSSAWSIHAHERFNEKRCPNSDMMPCPLNDREGPIWSRYPIAFPNITEGSEIDHPNLHNSNQTRLLLNLTNSAALSFSADSLRIDAAAGPMANRLGPRRHDAILNRAYRRKVDDRIKRSQAQADAMR